MHATIGVSGLIRIRTTERGLPLDITLDERALSVTPAELAQRILHLCQLAGDRARAARSQDLAASGYSASTLRQLNLEAPHDLNHAARSPDGDTDDRVLDWS